MATNGSPSVSWKSSIYIYIYIYISMDIHAHHRFAWRSMDILGISRNLNQLNDIAMLVFKFLKYCCQSVVDTWLLAPDVRARIGIFVVGTGACVWKNVEDVGWVDGVDFRKC